MTTKPASFTTNPILLSNALAKLEPGRRFKMRTARLKGMAIYFNGERVATIDGFHPVAVDANVRVRATGYLDGGAHVLLLQDNGHLYAASANGPWLEVLPSVEDLAQFHGA